MNAIETYFNEFGDRLPAALREELAVTQDGLARLVTKAS